MPDTRTLPFRERLALDLSDLTAVGDLAAADAGAPRIDVTIRTHFVAMDELPPPPDDPLRRRDDPIAGLYRQFMAGLRDDFKKVDPVLMQWLRASPKRAEEFAEDPASVIGKLSRVEPEVKARVAGYFGRQKTRVMPQLAGVNVTEMTFDAIPSQPHQLPASSSKAGEDINADALFQVGLSHLVCVFAEKMLPAIREVAALVPFTTGAIAGTVRLLAEDPGDPQLELDSSGTIKMTIGFGITQLELVPLVGQPTIVNLGRVTLEARLELLTTNRSGGADVNLLPAANGLTINEPQNLSLAPAGAWDAASAAIVQLLKPYFTFLMPLQFPAGLCGIAPRKIAAKLLPKGESDTQESLALAIGLLESTVNDPLDPGAASRVKSGQDGAIFLSNLLMVEVACCLLTQSTEFGGLPAPVHEATEAEPFCRWEHISDFTLGGESYDELTYFEISVVDGGLRTELQVKKNGTGWRLTATLTTDLRLNLSNGLLSASQAIPKLVVETEMEWWAKILAIVSIVAGILMIAFTPLTIAGGVVLAFGLALLAVLFIVTELADAALPNLADPTQLLGLLPTGISEKLGALSFLTALDWDDLEFGGYMTLPGSPSLVAGADVILQRGSAIDLDTGEIIPAAEIGARKDADLRMHESPGLVANARGFAAAPTQPSPPSAGGGSAPSMMFFSRGAGIDFGGVVTPLRGRRLETLGASRVVLFGARPYGSIGYSDLAQLVFAQSATEISIPAGPAPGSEPVMKTFAVRTSAGRLASCAVWTDQQHQTILRYRTFDTPVWLSIEPHIYIQTFGKPGVTDLIMIMNGNFTAMPGPQWPTQPPTSYRWFWSGAELVGSGTLDPAGNSFTIVGDRCQIVTVQGADLKGWLCTVATKPSGLETIACRNIHHIGRIPKPPDIPNGGVGGSGGPGGVPGSGGPGDGFGGGPHL